MDKETEMIGLSCNVFGLERVRYRVENIRSTKNRIGPDSVFVIRGRSAVQNQYSVVRIRVSTIACWYNKRCINTWRLSFFPMK